eukprot:scaffold25288_cov112-Isochrysis_galbana.AAC.4
MSDADNGQRLGTILARLRAVAASTSAQQGRYPAAGELTASTAQLDTLSVSHACGSMSCMVGPSQLAPHRLYVFARFVTPPKGV